MVRQKIVGARPDGRISAPARYALLRRSLRDVPQERVLRPAEGGGRIWDPPLHPAGAGTLEGRLGSAQRSGPGGKRSRPNPTAAPSICPGPLCGEQPLHPPGLGTLNGRPGSAQRSGTRGSRNTPIRSSSPSLRRSGYAGSQLFTEWVPAQGRRGPRRRKTDSHDPRNYEQEDRMVLLFVSASFPLDRARPVSFSARRKGNGGCIHREAPGPRRVSGKSLTPPARGCLSPPGCRTAAPPPSGPGSGPGST